MWCEVCVGFRRTDEKNRWGGVSWDQAWRWFSVLFVFCFRVNRGMNEGTNICVRVEQRRA